MLKIGLICGAFSALVATQTFAGAYSEPLEVRINLEASQQERTKVAKMDNLEKSPPLRKLKTPRKQRSKTDSWYDRNPKLVWGLTVAVGLLGMIGFGFGIGLSLTWLWILGLSFFPLLIVWVFVGGLIENNLVHLTTLLIVGWFLFGFGIEAVVLGLLFTIPWVWIMGGIVGLIFGAFSITQAILIGI